MKKIFNILAIFGVIFGVVLVIGGITMTIYFNNQFEKYKDKWWNSDDPEESYEAFDKMEYYTRLRFMSIGITIGGLLLTFAGVSFYIFTRVRRVSVNESRAANINQKKLYEDATNEEDKSLEIIQTIICPFCGSENILKKNFKDNSIKCNACDSEINL